MNSSRLIVATLILSVIGFIIFQLIDEQKLNYYNVNSNLQLVRLHEDFAKNKKVQASLLINNSKIKFINFWASWCGVCATERAVLVELWRALPKNKVEFLSVATSDTEADLKSSGKVKDNIYPLYFDFTEGLQRSMSVSALPQSFLLGVDNSVLLHIKGPVNSVKLKTILDMINQ
jgi:thiol-disulfide isomerase/thioredoxin